MSEIRNGDTAGKASASGGGPHGPPRIPDHELLRCIGSGSYGEVWLARNIIGTYRAIKIVYRKTFEDDRPYEREYRGIQRFEPVSRTHEGLVDILQVGRNETAGCFYYIMELCDDAVSAQHIDPDRYEAKTLGQELASRGKLPFAECLRLSTPLTSALHHLHQHGLIHRDIKPSNIIFVNGIPKIADIGLVTDIGTEGSLVGTIGYIPPEGPGSVQADIFSLGKVLYEMSTGKDRQLFPELPTGLGTDTQQQSEAMEFNEVVLRACERDPRLRYRSAGEMHADLLLLQAGKSVKRLRLLERRVALFMRLAVIVAVLGLTAGAFYYEIGKEQKRKAELRAREAELHQRQVGSYVAYGSAAMEEGDYLGSLPWFAEALRLDRADPLREENHQIRVASILRLSPEITRLWFHDALLNGAEFSADGRLLVTACIDGTARVWDVESEKLVAGPFGQRELNFAAFSPDARFVVTASTRHAAQVWDARTGQEVAGASPLPHPDGSEINTAMFNPSGDRVVTACSDGRVRVWQLHPVRKLIDFKAHDKGVLHAAFSPDGKHLATASEDDTAAVWTLDADGVHVSLAGPRLHHKSWVYWIAFSPDGNRVVTASFDRIAQIWDVATGRPAAAPIQHGAGVRSAEFSPDGRYILTACWDFTAQLHEAATGDAVYPILRHSGKHVMRASFHPDGHRILTADSHGIACVWDLAGNTWLPERTMCYYSGDGRRGARVQTNSVDVFDAAGSHPLFKAEVGSARVVDVKLTRDGRWMLLVLQSLSPSGSTDLTAQLWDGVNGSAVSRPFTLDPQPLEWVLSDDGQRLAASSGRTARVWQAATGTPVTELLVHSNGVARLAVNRDGSRVAAVSKDKVFLWDGNAGRLIRTLPHGTAVSSVEFSPDGKLLVTACSDISLTEYYAQIWSADTGEPMGEPLRHSDGVLQASFSPDGRWVVTASEDTTAQVWDVQTGKRLKALMKHTHQVWSAAFSPDGRWVVTLTGEGEARVWDAETGEPLTPPLRDPSIIRQATGASVQFIGDGAGILFRGPGEPGWTWALARDTRPERDLAALAGLLSGSRNLSESRGLPETPEALRAMWEKLRSLYPDSFGASTESVIAWQRREARASEAVEQWGAALLHVDELIKLRASDPSLVRWRERLREHAARAAADTPPSSLR